MRNDPGVCDRTKQFALGQVAQCARPLGHSGYHMANNHVTWVMGDPMEDAMTLVQTAAAMGKEPTPGDSAKVAARKFWLSTAEEDFEKCWAKAVQRSAVDLVALGSMFGAKTESQRIRWGIAFYACGKAARIAGRIQSGEDPNPDDVLDLRVYAFMMAYVEQFGGWPWPTS